ncbi:MAG: hypothetical protein RLZ22_642 [Verrucomicrobiota bacterium]
MIIPLIISMIKSPVLAINSTSSAMSFRKSASPLHANSIVGSMH